MKRTSRSKILGTEEPQTTGDLVPTLSTPTPQETEDYNRMLKIPLGHRMAIKALIESGKTYDEVSKQERIPKSTISRIMIDPFLKRIEDKPMGMIKKGLAAMWYDLGSRAVCFIDDDKLRAASAAQLAMIAGIATDKARLAEGLSTENIAVRGVAHDLASALKDIAHHSESLEKAA